MRDRDYYKQLVHRTCRAVCRLLEIVIIAALPIYAFVWSGRYMERMQLLEAAIANLNSLGNSKVEAVGRNDEDDKNMTGQLTTEAVEEDYVQPVVSPQVDIKGVVNTGDKQGSDNFMEESLAAFSNGEYISRDYKEKLLEMAKDNVKVAEILSKPDDYPGELFEMLAKYPETLQFVYDYPIKKDYPAAKNVGQIIEDEIPLLLQWDERWGYEPYGDFLIANSGCGPTCLSMVIVGLTGDTSVTPKVVADFADANGYYESGAGSLWSLMTEGALHFGLAGKELGLDKQAVLGELDAGHPIICSMGPGDFTYYGHFIVLTKNIDGKIRVNDPNSCGNSGKLWTYEELEGQILNLWSFEIS